MTDAAVFRNHPGLYDEDFYLWAKAQARLLRERRFEDLDLDNLADEVDGVGRSEKREIRNGLAVLLTHLLKWRYQPGNRTSSWRHAIRNQRLELRSVLEDSPSLSRYPAEVFGQAYEAGRLGASRDTGIDLTLLPETPPFTVDQALDEAFLPREPDRDDPSPSLDRSNS